MSKGCPGTSIPTVNEEALKCCSLISTDCILTEEAIPCIQIGKGETLTKVFKRLCTNLKSRIYNVVAGDNTEVETTVVGNTTTYTISAMPSASGMLVSNRFWANDFSAFNTGEWLSQNSYMLNSYYQSALEHTVITGGGLYEVYVELAITMDNEAGNLAQATVGLRVNGIDPVTPVQVLGENLDNFLYTDINISTINTPITMKMYVNLDQGDTVMPDIRRNYMAGSGALQLDAIKMAIKKM